MKLPLRWLPRHRESEPVSELLSRALLISIQPRFADAILDGTKTIELRRTMPTLPEDAVALIYSSSPVKALVGWATVDEIVHSSPRSLWKVHKESTGVTKTEFDEYFAGKDEAYGLRLSTVCRAGREVGIEALRSRGLEPPQSWRYVSEAVATALQGEMRLHPTAAPA